MTIPSDWNWVVRDDFVGFEFEIDGIQYRYSVETTSFVGKMFTFKSDHPYPFDVCRMCKGPDGSKLNHSDNFSWSPSAGALRFTSNGLEVTHVRKEQEDERAEDDSRLQPQVEDEEQQLQGPAERAEVVHLAVEEVG